MRCFLCVGRPTRESHSGGLLPECGEASLLRWQAVSGQARAGWGRECAGKLCTLLAGGKFCLLGCKEYSMVAHPSSSPQANPGALSLLLVQTFSQVPSVVVFHSPALSLLLSPPMTHHFLIPQAISTLSTPACSHGLGLIVQPPPKCLGFWCFCQWFR